LNFRLKTNFQNIKTVGEIVRLVITTGGNTMNKEYSGMGIRFSLLPSEDIAMLNFTEAFINYSVTGFRETRVIKKESKSSSLPQSKKHILYKVEAKNSLISLFKWWMKETVTRVFRINYLLVGLLLLLVILAVFIAFL